MDNTDTDTKKNFNWKAFFFTVSYFAGFGNFKKALVFMLIGFHPLLILIVGIYGGKTANRDLPVENFKFSWVPAIGFLVLHSIYMNFMTAFISSFIQGFKNAG
ncbi:hypothetical protein MCEMSE6_01559 [Oxalobacteraceae bacterium]